MLHRFASVAAALIGIMCVVGSAIYAITPSSVAAGAGDVVGYTPPPQPVTALWLGDSYTAGTGAASPRTGEACLTSDALGWTCMLDAEGGTGFINNGHSNQSSYAPLPARLAADRSIFPRVQVVVVDAGRNDSQYTERQVRPVVEKYLKDVREAFPKARMVLIVPYYLTSSRPIGKFSSIYHSIAPALHAQVINPVAEGWVSRSKTGKLTVADHVHPTPAGHQYLASHLAGDMRALKLPLCRACVGKR